MGAAGLTCSTCETASRGGTGIEIDLAKVPKREPGMTPYEILLSESQERMLIIAKHGQGRGRARDFRKMGCAVRRDRSRHGRRHDARAQQRRGRRGNSGEATGRRSAALFARSKGASQPHIGRDLGKHSIRRSPSHLRSCCDNCCAIPPSLRRIGFIASTITWFAPARSLGPVRTPRSFSCAKRTRFWPQRRIAIRSIAGSIRARAARIAVAEAARNLTCSGARPLAVTDNLNFGNPYKPEIFWQLREAVEGMAEACRAFGTPVTGGNVSLYNESPAGVVDPTPTVAMVGLIDEEAHITTQFFKDDR